MFILLNFVVLTDNASPDPEIQQLLNEAHETLDLNEDLVYMDDNKRNVRYMMKSFIFLQNFSINGNMSLIENNILYAILNVHVVIFYA